MSARKLNVPPSWDRMTRFARAHYILDTHQAKTWREAIAKSVCVRPKKVAVAEIKGDYWWNNS